MILSLALLSIPCCEAANAPRGELVQIREDFSADPGWDGWQNRVECGDCPTITQDFGWSPTSHFGGKPGEIGGVIWKSTTPAWYAMPIGKPLSFKDSFSASGRIVVMPPAPGDAYFGFFGAERPGWRMWSSLAFRLMDSKEGACMVDYKTGTCKSGLFDPGAVIPYDGKPHTWSLNYDPEGVPDLTWPDPKMVGWLTEDWRLEPDVLERAKKDYPDITVERLRELLGQAFNRGIVDKHMLKGVFPRWHYERTEGRKGKVTFTVDDKTFTGYLQPGHCDEPTFIDRFGIFNQQIYSGKCELYLSDLVVNGHKIDLSKDPHWEGRGNRVTFVERDFHEKMDFGYSETNWAGESPGEIGGKFWSTEPVDPYHGYYADEIGELTLDDRISFSGSVCFVDGGPDGQSFLGYFNRAEKMAAIQDEHSGYPMNQSMGIAITDNTSIGYRFSAVCSPTLALSRATKEKGPIFVPTRERRKFTFDYDPNAGGTGRITVTLDGQPFTLDLTPEMRRQGAKFDRFGLTNVRRGGKYQVIYFDDLTYTARRSAGQQPAKHEQTTVTSPYPPGGRAY